MFPSLSGGEIEFAAIPKEDVVQGGRTNCGSRWVVDTSEPRVNHWTEKIFGQNHNGGCSWVYDLNRLCWHSEL